MVGYHDREYEVMVRTDDNTEGAFMNTIKTFRYLKPKVLIYLLFYQSLVCIKNLVYGRLF